MLLFALVHKDQSNIQVIFNKFFAFFTKNVKKNVDLYNLQKRYARTENGLTEQYSLAVSIITPSLKEISL